jgi:hypothetical protein
MSRFQRHVAWAWLVALAAGMVVVAALRLGPDNSGSPSEAVGDAGNVVPGPSGALAATAQRLRLLQMQVTRLREQMAAVQAEATDRHERLAAIDGLLCDESYTECPPFLQEDTTFRALQKIVREAAGSPTPAAGGEERLSTAAAVARERLRAKLELMRDQLTQEASDLDTQTDLLRLRLHSQAEEVEHLQALMQDQLQSDPGSSPVPAP